MNKESISRILEAFAYIAERAPAHKKNMYNILKVFYLADKLHMERFGRFIFEDRYAAMAKGPVPSATYDLIKDIRSGKELPFSLNAPVSLDSNHRVNIIRSADEDLFSGSDLLCLDEVIERSESEDLGDLSHDDAWNNTSRNTLMSEDSIISTLRNSEALLELHHNRHP
ncbi:Panacea domain-containing protein [Alteromonas sp. 1_MG-2023]|uniref:Panacea domain-containing protein n=1 Tax=Alteromonas sp. 1_MG-2023 TaxID=3062669 RepID=UPI0026E2CE81|nr:Panacea domain-containing protein [Alteromonas sp. 1_MG-2023]MDO6474365.1 Panacea domain-containing protein [Alteromonas sp. 1_MG-2023]